MSAKLKRAAGRLRLKNYQHPDLYGDWLGYRVEKVDAARYEAVVSLVLRDDHLSPAGRVHGGVVAGFFDFACGAAVFSTLGPDDFCSTVELKVNYFRPLFSGDRLRSRARVVFRGRRLCVIHAYLHREGDKPPVGMATATFNVVTAAARSSGPRPRSAGSSRAGRGNASARTRTRR